MNKELNVHKDTLIYVLGNLNTEKDIDKLLKEELDDFGKGSLYGLLVGEERGDVIKTIGLDIYSRVLLKLALQLGAKHIAKLVSVKMTKMKKERLNEHVSKLSEKYPDVMFIENEDYKGIRLVYSITDNNSYEILPLIYNVLEKDRFYNNCKVIVYYRNISDELIRLLKDHDVILEEVKSSSLSGEYAMLDNIFSHICMSGAYSNECIFLRGCKNIITNIEASIVNEVMDENCLFTLKDNLLHTDPIIGHLFHMNGYFNNIHIKDFFTYCMDNKLSMNDIIYIMCELAGIEAPEYNITKLSDDYYDNLVEHLFETNKSFDYTDRPGFYVGYNEGEFFTIKDDGKVNSVDVTVHTTKGKYNFNFTGKEILVPAYVLEKKFRQVNNIHNFYLKVDVR